MKRILTLSILAAAVLATGCTRIETGEVGLRVGFDKQVKNEELLPGSFNQVLIGSVMTFPVKEVAVKVDDITPQASDNSTMKDFDLTVIYNINQSQIAEIYNSKNKSFHATFNGDTYLMYNYIFNAARNATYKAARKYEALNMGDNRQTMEADIKELVTKTLSDEKLDGTITITQVLIRSIIPADSVVASANELVRAKNETKQKEAEVRTAKLEAERIQALAQNAGAIQYMDAQARMMQAEAAKITAQSIASFKGQTLVIGAGTNVNVGK
jgi:regulator of protease activity HflC (stomatin/prohibitin superfamily)